MMTTETEALHKRLIYNSWHRGTKEADMVLGPFAALFVPGFTPLQLAQYEEILNLPDSDLMDWIYGHKSVPDDVNNDVMQRIIAFAHREHSDGIFG